MMNTLDLHNYNLKGGGRAFIFGRINPESTAGAT
jgi:hypothetical protein